MSYLRDLYLETKEQKQINKIDTDNKLLVLSSM